MIGRLDDLARRLGHQAAHAGELAHLRGRAARAGMRHHVDRVDLRLAAGLRVLLDRRDLASSSRRRSASVHFDQASTTLLYFSPWVIRPSLYCCSNSLASVARLVDDLPLRLRHDHVVLAERDAGLEGVVEAERHDAVAEDHRLLLPAVAVDGVDHVGDFALRHQLVDDVERNLRCSSAAPGRASRGRASSRTTCCIGLPFSSSRSQRYLILVCSVIDLLRAARARSRPCRRTPCPAPGSPSRMSDR